MDIRLKPELEKLVEEDAQRGPYRIAGEFVERAVVLPHEQENWVEKHAVEIGAKVGEGYAATKRGELIDAERVRAAMEEKKRVVDGEVLFPGYTSERALAFAYHNENQLIRFGSELILANANEESENQERFLAARADTFAGSERERKGVGPLRSK